MKNNQVEDFIDQALPVSFIFIKPAIWGIRQNTRG